MLKFCVEQWDKNKKKLEKHITENLWMWNEFEYKEVVEKVVEYIFNDDESDYSDAYDSENITQIDNGDYQGTLLYIIPRKTYQPSEDEYLMTFVGYGSCSGCDTLQSVQDVNEEDEKSKEGFVKDMMFLCLHIIQNTIKPYNYSYLKDDKYNEVESGVGDW
jgi:hypothetical protein